MRRARRPRQVAALAAVIVLVAACSGDGLSAPSTPTGAVSTDTVSSDTSPADGSGPGGASDPGDATADGTAATDDGLGDEPLAVLDDVVAEPWEPTTRTDELALQLADAGDRVPVQAAVDAFAIAYAPLPGTSPSDLPDGDGLGSTYTLGLIESVRDRLAPEQIAALDAIDAAVEDEVVLSTTDAVDSGHGSGFAGAGVAGPGVAFPAPRGPVTDKYLKLLQQAVADWQAYRPTMALPPTISLQLMTYEVKGDMDAFPTEPGVCRVRVFPSLRSSAPSDVTITTAFAHEVFHCAQFQMGDWAATPNWVIEGGASFASFDLYRAQHDPPARYAIDNWFRVGSVPLAVREYSAWPLFETFRQYGGDPYAAIAAIIASPSMDPAAALATGGLDGTWFRTEWGSRVVRSTSFTDPPWALAWPGPSGGGGPRDNIKSIGTRGLGTYHVSTTGGFSQQEVAVDVASDVGILAVVPVYGPMTTHASTGTVVIPAQELVKFCFSDDGCACPEGQTSNTLPMGDRRMIYSFASGDQAPTAVVKAVKWDPKKQCRKKPRERGTHNGDPHLVTFDGVAYDVMKLGEVVMARDPDGGFEVQARHEPIGLGGVGTSAVALTDGTHRVTFTAPALESAATLTIRVDGDEVDPAAPGGPAGLQIAVVAEAREWTVTWADGSTVDLSWHLGWFVTVSPSDERAPRLVGLLGAANDDPRDDLRLPDGTVFDPGADQARIDDEFAEAWLVDDDTTRFDYEPGQSPAGFAAVEPTGVPPAPTDDAVQRCTDSLGEAASSYEIDACAYDVTVTGDDTYVDAYVVEVDDRVADEDEPLAPGAGDAGPPSGDGTDPTAPHAGEAALQLSGLLAASYAAVADDSQVSELVGSLTLHAGAVVIAAADLCAGEVTLTFEVTRRDTGDSTQTFLCDPSGMREVFADEDDEVIDGEVYVLIGADGDYDVRVTSDSEEPVFTEVAVFADGEPEVVDGDEASADGWSGTLSGTGDAVVLPISTGEDSVTYDLAATDDVCISDVYGTDPPGDAAPWVIDVCEHGPAVFFTPTFELVVPVVVFDRTGADASVSITRAADSG